MPSMPRCHEIPKSVIQVRFTSNWKPASRSSKAARSQSVMAPVPVANSRATSRCSSTRPFGIERHHDGADERARRPRP